MPIRINLLAEAQLLEEMRRKDPVKRAIWVGVGLCIMMLIWSGSLQLKAMAEKGDLNRMEDKRHEHTNEFALVQSSQRKLEDANNKLRGLQQVATNRFLNGPFLDALQHATADNVQLTRVHTDHTYIPIAGTDKKTDSKGGVTPARPPVITERIMFTFQGKSTSPNPDDQVDKLNEQIDRLKRAIAAFPWFQQTLGRTNEFHLRDATQLMHDPDGKPSITFTLEGRAMDKTR